MIKAEEVGCEAYSALFPDAPHLFNNPEYALLYRDKCVRLHFIVFSDHKVRAGIIAGERDGRLQSPFSAPYGGFTFPRRLRFPMLAEVAGALDGYARRLSLGVRITLPPVFHSSDEVSSTAYVLGRIEGFKCVTDLNYHLPLSARTDILTRMAPSAREALRRAMRFGLRFSSLTLSEANIERAYSIIETNHKAHGYPMNVSRFDMVRTCMAVGADIFTVTDPEGHDVAAALVYRPVAGIAQPVGWGDLPDARHMRPMTLLAASLSRHYAAEGMKALDLGPSTDSGQPEAGLCFFKETLGCESSLKFTFIR